MRSISRSRTGSTTLELWDGLAYKRSSEKVLGDRLQVRALTTEVTLWLKNLDEVVSVGIQSPFDLHAHANLALKVAKV